MPVRSIARFSDSSGERSRSLQERDQRKRKANAYNKLVNDVYRPEVSPAEKRKIRSRFEKELSTKIPKNPTYDMTFSEGRQKPPVNQTPKPMSSKFSLPSI